LILQLWKTETMDLHLTPYGCIATGDFMGMIEGKPHVVKCVCVCVCVLQFTESMWCAVVPEAETTAAIQKAAGGVTAAFRQTPLANWLRSNNPSGLRSSLSRAASARSRALTTQRNCRQGLRRGGDEFHQVGGRLLR
jgi:hypothetical protein